MSDDIEDNARIVYDDEVESPVLVDASLPEVLGFIILLGAQRRVLKILRKQPHLLQKCLLRVWRGSFKCDNNPRVVVVNLHRARVFVFLLLAFLRSLFNEAIISSAVLNGPAVWPRFTSSNDFARRASMMRRCAGVYS